MNITTKFVENDIVYFLLNGKIMSGAVTQFSIIGTTTLLYQSSYTVKFYRTVNTSATAQTFVESSLFSSPQELTQALIQEFKNSLNNPV